MRVRTLTISILFILSIPFGLTAGGCDAFPSLDGKVQSAVTDEYSDEQQIRSAYNAQKSSINAEADELGIKQSRLITKNTQLDENFESDLGFVGDEIEKKNKLFASGLGITKTAISIFAPEATPFANMAVNWLGDLGILGGLGFGAAKFGKRKGLVENATNFATLLTEAADKDPELRKDIKDGNLGKVLKKLHQSSPKVVQDTIDRHKII